MMVMKVKLLHKDAKIPFYATDGAGSFDLVATEVEKLADNRYIVKFGIATEIPPGFVVTFKPRSSFTHKGWVLANSPAEIDSDYRGEWIAKFEAIPDNVGLRAMTGGPFLKYPSFPYQVGDRVVQAKLERQIKVDFEEVEELSKTVRGDGGFGSTDAPKFAALNI